MERRLLIAGATLGCGLLLVFGRLVQLTTIHNEDLARQAFNQHQTKMEIPPRRGAIVDCNGNPLALSVPAESIFVRPQKLPADAGKWVAPLATALHLSTEQVRESFQ